MVSDLKIFWTVTLGCTITTNLSLLALILTRRKLQSPSNIYVISLSLSGLLFGLIYLLPRFVVDGIMQYLFICKILIYVGILFIINLNLHTCVISYDHCFAIVFPFKYRQITSKRISIVICAIIWFLSILFCITPMVTFDRYTKTCLSEYRYADGNTNQTVFFSVPILNVSSIPTLEMVPGTLIPKTVTLSPSFIFNWRIYILVLLLVLFLIPLIALVLTYAAILFVVFTQTKRLNSFTIAMAAEDARRPKKSLILQNRKALSQVTICIGTFLIFYVPYVTMTIIFLQHDLQFASRAIADFSLITQFVAFTYPAINPLLYAFYSKDINTEIAKMVCRKSTTINLPIGTDRTRQSSEDLNRVKLKDIDISNQLSNIIKPTVD